MSRACCLAPIKTATGILQAVASLQLLGLSCHWRFPQMSAFDFRRSAKQ